MIGDGLDRIGSTADRILQVREVKIRMAESQDPELDLIAVGAHPDDVEIACGGTLARLASKGYAVGIVDLTDGEPTPHSPGPEVRLAEAERAAEILGVVSRINLNLPNRRLFDTLRGAGRARQGVPAAQAQGRHRVRRQDRARLARSLPGDADHRRGRLLQPADQVG